MTAKDLKNVIIPTPNQVFGSIAISLIWLVITFKEALLSLFFGGTGGDFGPYLNESYKNQLVRFSGLPLVDFLVKVIFWAGVGLIAYLIFLAVSNVVIEARNEAVVEAEYVNKAGLSQRFRNPIKQVIVAVVLIGLLLISISWLLPLWLGIFGSGLAGGFGLFNLLSLLVAVLGLSFNIYLLWMLGQLAFAID